MADGLAPACDVNVAAVSSVPVGLPALNVVLAWTFALVVIATYARLAQIVESRPHNVADDVGIVVDVSPVCEGFAWVTLRLPHHALRGALMVGGMLVHHVVVTSNVEHFEVWVIDFPVFVPRTESFGDWARLVTLLHGSLQFASCGYYGYLLAFENLVAYAP